MNLGTISHATALQNRAGLPPAVEPCVSDEVVRLSKSEIGSVRTCKGVSYLAILDWTSIRLIRCPSDHRWSGRSPVPAGLNKSVIVLRRILRSSFLLCNAESPLKGEENDRNFHETASVNGIVFPSGDERCAIRG